ncbi:MAG: CoA-binding protein, partial [Dehalococcoidia bacterium]
MAEIQRVAERETDDLGYMFYPRSVAVAGASSRPEMTPGKRFVQALLESDYGGGVYPLNSTGGEVLGLRAYTSILDVPEPVDHVICSIPAPRTPQLMRECVAKGVKVVHLFTAGFSETGTEEGRRLEAEIVSLARQGGIRIVGPNGMGLLCPDSGLSFFTTVLARGGPVAFLSQSGGNAQEVIQAGGSRGLGFSKVISYGNAADLNEADFLGYLARDTASEIIAAYIEGVRDGQRFAQALAEASETKPVIVLKGGRTTAGTRAANSHTGSLAGNSAIWHALCRQTGTMEVQSLDELVDLLVAFMYLSLPQGRRVGVVGMGGGRSVLSSDECESAGLIVPQFSMEVRQSLSEIIPEAGTSVRNPIDSAPAVAQNIEHYSRTLEIVAQGEGTDFLIVYLYADVPMYDDTPHLLQRHVEAAIQAARTSGKPAAMVLATSGAMWMANTVYEAQQACLRAGLAVYP